MASMQDHPIDLVRDQLALVAEGAGQGLMGLLTGLALIGGLYLTSLRPADAAGPGLGPDFTASAQVDGHMGVSPLGLDGSVVAQGGAVASSTSVCRLEIDTEAEAPLAATCVPVPGAPLLN